MNKKMQRVRKSILEDSILEYIDTKLGQLYAEDASLYMKTIDKLSAHKLHYSMREIDDFLGEIGIEIAPDYSQYLADYLTKFPFAQPDDFLESWTKKCIRVFRGSAKTEDKEDIWSAVRQYFLQISDYPSKSDGDLLGFFLLEL